MAPDNDLLFRLDARAPSRRRLEVELEVGRTTFADVPDASGAFTGILFLPTWTPGSYLIRDFARHLSQVRAEDAATGQPIPCRKVARSRFAVTFPPGCTRARLRYTVYTHDLSVRTSDLAADHAYWNHACVLLWPVDRRHVGAQIVVQIPPGWDFACALPRLPTADGTLRLRAPDLDAAMDAPCLAGRLQRIDFAVDGVPHRVVLDGLGRVPVPKDFAENLQIIVRTAAAVFGGKLPYAEYQFLCLFAESGHGGLEHRDSTTLLSARTAMRPGKDHQEFLGLAAHEFFHVWNVKRMRPAELWDYDYEAGNATSLLWLAEGFTAYYDDLILRRAGIVGVDDYLALLAKNLTTVLNGMGRFRLSLNESSFDAWIRLYRPDEHTRNSSQNYYGNGAVAAMCLDLAIRSATSGQRCLDDAMRDLYQTTYEADRGYTRADVEASLARAAGCDLAPLLSQLVDAALDPPLVETLAGFGVTLTFQDRDKPYLGIGFESGTTVVANITDDSPAYAAGLAPGDEVLALDGVRVTSERWSEVFQSVAAIDQPLPVLIASRGLVAQRTVMPTANPFGTARLELDKQASERAARLRAGWLALREPAEPS